MTSQNTPSVSAGEFIRSVSRMIIAALQKNIPLKHLPAIFVSGAPGIGKSMAVQQIADEVHTAAAKKVIVTDIRLLLFSPIDLRGIPTEDKTHEFTEWKRPKIFDLDPDQDVVNLLFLDELTSAVAAVQAAAYQITLNRAIGEFTLPDNCLVIAAGNRLTDRSVTYRMPQALSNRMMHFSLKAEPDSWRLWAVKNGVNSLVLGYLSSFTDKLFTEEPGLDDMAYPSPRSWMFVSDLLNLMGDKPDQLYTEICGCVGKAAALEFIAYCKVADQLPSVPDILDGKPVPMPKTPDALYALVSALTMVITSSDSISSSRLENCCRYCSHFPKDYQALFYQNLLAVERIKLIGMKCPSFSRWLEENPQEH